MQALKLSSPQHLKLSSPKTVGSVSKQQKTSSPNRSSSTKVKGNSRRKSNTKDGDKTPKSKSRKTGRKKSTSLPIPARKLNNSADQQIKIEDMKNIALPPPPPPPDYADNNDIGHVQDIDIHDIPIFIPRWIFK